MRRTDKRVLKQVHIFSSISNDFFHKTMQFNKLLYSYTHPPRIFSSEY